MSTAVVSSHQNNPAVRPTIPTDEVRSAPRLHSIPTYSPGDEQELLRAAVALRLVAESQNSRVAARIQWSSSSPAQKSSVDARVARRVYWSVAACSVVAAVLTALVIVPVVASIPGSVALFMAVFAIGLGWSTLLGLWRLFSQKPR